MEPLADPRVSPSRGKRPAAGAGTLAYVAKMFPRLSETFVAEEVAELRRARIPVRVYSLLAPAANGRMHPEYEDMARDTVVLPEISWRGRRELLDGLVACWRLAPGRTAREILRALARPTPARARKLLHAVVLAERLRRDEISHIHASWAHSPAQVAAIASRLTGIPWSMAAHAKDIHTSPEDALACRMEHARFTLACTRSHRDHLRSLVGRHGRGRGADIRLRYHGVDTVRFSPSPDGPTPPDPPVILSVGRLVQKKGFDTLIDAAALLQRKGVRFSLDIIGEGPVRAELESRIRRHGLERIVRLRGQGVRDEIRDAMRRCACFALACRVTAEGDRDGVPNTLAEAMACGVPVVSTHLPSVEELVIDGESGVLVPPDDPRALAGSLETLLLDPDERARLGREARNRVLAAFSAERGCASRVRLLDRARKVHRVLFFSADRGVPVRGQKGASIHVRSLVEAWRGQGVRSLVVTTREGPPEGPPVPASVRAAGVSAPWESRIRFVARRLGADAAMERALLRLADNATMLRAGREAARGWRPDVLYERYSLAAFAGSLLARRLGIPHVLEVNAPLVEEEARHRGLRLGWLTRRLESWLFRRADRVLVVSPALRDHAIRLGVRPHRVRVVPNGVDPVRFHPDRDGDPVRERLALDGQFTAGFAGTLKPWHGVDHLIRGFLKAADEEPRMALLILGDGPERKTLENLSRRSAHSDRIHFLGSVPHEEMGAYLAACHALCAPYGPDEGFYFSPLKIAEYLAAGRPVIASRVGHLATTLSEATGTVLVEPGDDAALGRALVDLARDPERRAALGRAAASSRWTWADVARRTLHEFEAARATRWGWSSTRPVRVGYVLMSFPRFSETFILNEILELERTGVRVTVFSMRRPDEKVRQPGVSRVRAPVLVNPTGIRAVTAGVAAHLHCLLHRPRRYLGTVRYVRRLGSGSAWRLFLAAAWIAAETRRRGIGHLHAHFASGPARQVKLASMLCGIPFSFTAHARDLYWSGYRHHQSHRLKRRVRLASFVVAISERNRRFFGTLGFHIPRRRVVRLYNGLDLEEWTHLRPAGRPAVHGATITAAPIVLAVGRLVEKKGFHDLIEAAARLCEAGVAFRCRIAGEGPERARLEESIRRLGLEERVTLLGPVAHDRLLAEHYLEAHVLVQPCVVASDGDQDGIPMVILEAMAVGLPVVATPVSGIGEAVVHGKTGLLVPPGEPWALADALARVLRDDSLAASLAGEARGLVERRFDLRRNVRLLAHLFRSSAHRTPRWKSRRLRVELGVGP
jgi:glycosyltransferase involved in cell wall biosynthesis